MWRPPAWGMPKGITIVFAILQGIYWFDRLFSSHVRAGTQSVGVVGETIVCTIFVTAVFVGYLRHRRVRVVIGPHGILIRDEFNPVLAPWTEIKDLEFTDRDIKVVMRDGTKFRSNGLISQGEIGELVKLSARWLPPDANLAPALREVAEA